MKVRLLISIFVLLGTVAQGQAAPSAAASVICELHSPALAQLSEAQQTFIKLQLVGQRFTLDRIDEMSERMRDAFQQLGYFRVDVKKPDVSSIAIGDAHNCVSLNFAVQMGSRYKLRNIEWIGATMFPATYMQSLSPMQSGDVFDTSKVRQLLGLVRDLYVANGKPDFSLNPETRVAGDEIILTLFIKESS